MQEFDRPTLIAYLTRKEIFLRLTPMPPVIFMECPPVDAQHCLEFNAENGSFSLEEIPNWRVSEKEKEKSTTASPSWPRSEEGRELIVLLQHPHFKPSLSSTGTVAHCLNVGCWRRTLRIDTAKGTAHHVMLLNRLRHNLDRLHASGLRVNSFAVAIQLTLATEFDSKTPGSGTTPVSLWGSP
jgi:hypothetical protein